MGSAGGVVPRNNSRPGYASRLGGPRASLDGTSSVEPGPHDNQFNVAIALSNPFLNVHCQVIQDGM